MQEFFKLFMFFIIVIILWIAFILLQDKRGNSHLNRWFAIFLCALTTPQMDTYAALTVADGGIWQISVVAASFLWLKGPFIWIFLQVLARRDASLRNVWPHFLPWLCALIALLTFSQSWQIVMLMGMAHMLIYLFFAAQQLVKARPYIAQLWIGFQNTAYYWLLYVIGGLMLLVVIDFVVMSLVLLGVMQNYRVLDFYVFPCFSIYVLSIGILSVYRPELWFRSEPEALPHNAEIPAINPDVSESLPNMASKDRYLALDVDLAKILLQQLSNLMQDQRIYRQSELSLPSLAALLNISVHQLSELLNVHLGQGFYDYINSYRLQYACRLLSDPACHLRVIDTAFEAGFNNKNSFYRAFKEVTGVTPAQYRINSLDSSRPLPVAGH